MSWWEFEDRNKRLIGLGYSSYDDYTSSDHWKQFRDQVLRMTPRRCTACSDDEARLELHHRTYWRLGREFLEDVSLLCGRCHDTVHKISSWENVSIDEATEIVIQSWKDV